MTAQTLICELPSRGTASRVRLLLETDDHAVPLQVMRRDDDIFFVNGDAEIIAALVQVPSSSVAVAVA